MKKLLTLRNEQLRIHNLEPEVEHLSYQGQWISLFEYGNLLDKILEFKDFIPCKDGKPLEKPVKWDLIAEKGIRISIINTMSEDEIEAVKAYRTALDAVIFEGWEVVGFDPVCCIIEAPNCEIYFHNSKNSNRVQFCYLDKPSGTRVKVNTIDDLAHATAENPIKLKTK